MKNLERHLGLFGVVAISMSAMIGSGIFVLPGLASAMTGPAVWLAYVAAALGALPAALSKAELSSAMPTSGGTYVYVDRTFGPLLGTITGLGLWMAMLLKSAFALVGFSAYLQGIADVSLKPMALGLLVVVATLNILGVRKVSRVQLVVVSVGMVGLGMLVGLGIPRFEAARLSPMFPYGAAGFFAAVGFVFVSYAGVTQIAAIAEEVKNPSRNLPLGIFLSLALVTAIYAAVTLMLVGTLPLGPLAEDLRPIATLAEHLAGPAAGVAMALLAVITMTSMANAGLLASSRFPFAMSRDRLLPDVASRLSRRFMTPVVGILLTATLMGVAIVALDLERIIKLASVILILLFLIENVTVIVLRESSASWYKPAYRSPGYPWMQGIGIVAGIALLIGLGTVSIVAILVAVVPGTLLYVSYGRRRTARRGVVGLMGPRRELLSDRLAPEAGAPPGPASAADGAGPEFSPPAADAGVLPESAAVLVPLFGVEHAPEALVEIGGALADGQRLVVARITEVPEQTVLEAVEGADLAASSLKRRLRALAETEHLDLLVRTLVTHDAIHLVERLTQRLGVGWAVLEWRERRAAALTLGSPIGWLIGHLGCNLALFRDAGVRYVRRILVAAEPGPNDALVVRTADHLARVEGARLVLARVVPTGAAPAVVQSQGDYLDQLRQLCQAPTEAQLLSGDREERALVAASAGADLLVMGGPPASTFWSKVFGTPHDYVIENAACSVLRLQTPREATHAALDGEDTSHPAQALLGFLNLRGASARLDATRKDSLFQALGVQLAELVEDIDPKEIVEALWAREKLQNTAVGQGLAMPHATLSGLTRTVLGLFTTAAPIDYQAPDGAPVDVFFVTLGPPGDRQAHLLLLAGLASLVSHESLLDHLRAAETPDAMLAAVRTAARTLVEQASGA